MVWLPYYSIVWFNVQLDT